MDDTIYIPVPIKNQTIRKRRLELVQEFVAQGWIFAGHLKVDQSELAILNRSTSNGQRKDKTKIQEVQRRGKSVRGAET